MRYNIGDTFVLTGIECRVAFINGEGNAYLVPETDGELYNNQVTLKGLVFAILDKKGRDKLGNPVHSVMKHECGAV